MSTLSQALKHSSEGIMLIPIQTLQSKQTLSCENQISIWEPIKSMTYRQQTKLASNNPQVASRQ